MFVTIQIYSHLIPLHFYLENFIKVSKTTCKLREQKSSLKDSILVKHGVYGQIFHSLVLPSTTSSYLTTTSSSTSRVSSSTTKITSTTSSYMTSGSSSSLGARSQSRTFVISSVRSNSLASSETLLPSTIDSPGRRILPSQSKSNNRLLWPWFVFGAINVTACSCISFLGYLIKRHLSQKDQASPNEQDLSTFTSSPVSEERTHGYSKTPDFVTADPEQRYSKTPDFVTADPEQRYSKTPDFVTADPEHGYSKTPDFVTAASGE